MGLARAAPRAGPMPAGMVAFLAPRARIAQVGLRCLPGKIGTAEPFVSSGAVFV